MTGWNRLIAKLSVLPTRTQIAIKTVAMATATKKVQGTAKRKASAYHGDLKKSIKTKELMEGDTIKGIVYSNSDHATYVEFGTGPEGASNHAGISPNVSVSYRTEPWWIPGSEVGRGAPRKYHWPMRKLADGEKIYWTDGQKAQPFMYPALKENEEKLPIIFKRAVMAELRRLST